MVTQQIYSWRPFPAGFFWEVKRVLWTDWAGIAYQIDKVRPGKYRKFWTRKAAQARADALNEEILK